MIINSSRYGTAQACPSKYYWNYHRDIVPIYKSVPLVRGGSMHEAWAHWYTYGDAKAAADIAEQGYLKVAKAGRFIEEELAKADENARHIRRVMEGYFLRYPKEDWTLQRAEVKFKVFLGESCPKCSKEYPEKVPDLPNNELAKLTCYRLGTFNTHCTEPIHVLVGRADLVVSWKQNIWVVEHKTHKAVGSNLLRGYSRRMQTTGYVYGTSKALKIKIKGYILNIAKMTKTPDYIRDVFFVPQAQQEKFVADAREMAENIARWESRGHWQQDTSECYHWSACSYVPLCDLYKPYHKIPDTAIMPLGFGKRELDYGDANFQKPGEKNEPEVL